MKKWLVAICVAFMLTTSVAFGAEQGNLFGWHPVCRHKAIYWAITLGEDYPTRIMYGHFLDLEQGMKWYHVQPQVYVGDKWWYFEVESDHYVRLITLPELTIDYGDHKAPAKWVPTWTFPNLNAYIDYMDKLQKKVPK